MKYQFHKCLCSDEINVVKRIQPILIQTISVTVVSLLLTVEVLTPLRSAADWWPDGYRNESYITYTLLLILISNQLSILSWINTQPNLKRNIKMNFSIPHYFGIRETGNTHPLLPSIQIYINIFVIEAVLHFRGS